MYKCMAHRANLVGDANLLDFFNILAQISFPFGIKPFNEHKHKSWF